MHNYIVFLKIYGMLGDFRINRDAKVKKGGILKLLLVYQKILKYMGCVDF